MRLVAPPLIYFTASTLTAQPATPPLIVMANGVVYRYEEGSSALEPLDFCAGDYAKPPLVLSPDGTRVAYRVVPSARAGDAEFFDPTFTVASEIVICDLAREMRIPMASGAGRPGANCTAGRVSDENGM